jgi:hypothetical protein
MSRDHDYRHAESWETDNPFRASRFATCAATPLAVLSILALLTGVAGMCISFLYLHSRRVEDVMAGAAGFAAGSAFIAGGLIALAVLSRSPATNRKVFQALAAQLVFVPPFIMMLAWPILFFSFFIIGILLIPVVAVVCLTLAWPISRIAADNLASLVHAPDEEDRPASRLLVFALFLCQAIMILATAPAWGVVIETLEAMGISMGVGWS